MGHLKVCLPCNKLDIYGKNIKMPSNATMERDLENPTPTIDLEPLFIFIGRQPDNERV